MIWRCPTCGAVPPDDAEVRCPQDHDWLVPEGLRPAQGLMGGRYRLMGRLGRGGQARIYVGVDEQLERRVAVKLLTLQEAEDEARFAREARVLARLRSAHTVRLYDYGVEARPGGDQPFIVMELVPGESLESRLEEGPLALRDTNEIVMQLAGALREAHGRGIIHRDLKPANVLLRPELQLRPQAVLVDFGIAFARDGRSLTQVGAGAMGSVHYMSPEQCRGERVGPASDVYSLAVTTWRMLAGWPPYDGDRADALVHQHLHAPVPELPPHWPPALRKSLDRVLAGGMAKRVPDRTKSVEAFAHALDEAVCSADTLPQLEAATIPTPPQRKSWLPWVAVTLLSAGLGYVIASSWTHEGPPPAPRIVAGEASEEAPSAPLRVKAPAKAPDAPLEGAPTPATPPEVAPTRVAPTEAAAKKPDRPRRIAAPSRRRPPRAHRPPPPERLVPPPPPPKVSKRPGPDAGLRVTPLIGAQ